MPRLDDEFLLKLLQACADCAPEPLYPARYAREHNVERASLDDGLDELRKRGLIQFTDWVKDLGQGRALTDAGKEALETGNLDAVAPTSINAEVPAISIYQRGEMVRGALYDSQKAYVSWFLLALNVAYFLFGAGYARYHDLPVKDYLLGEDGVHRTTTFVIFDLGGLWRPIVLADPRVPENPRPELERIILSCFVHIGILHLGMNMAFLASLGGLIESMWGRWRFLAIYLIGAVAGSCAVLSVDLLQNTNTHTAGASGALCGLFGSMLVWFLFNRQHMPDQLLNDWSRSLAVNTVLLVGVTMLPNVSWQAHIGGAVGGALAALLFQAQRFHPSRVVRILALLGVPLIPVLMLAGVFWQAGWFSPLPS